MEWIRFIKKEKCKHTSSSVLMERSLKDGVSWVELDEEDEDSDSPSSKSSLKEALVFA